MNRRKLLIRLFLTITFLNGFSSTLFGGITMSRNGFTSKGLLGLMLFGSGILLLVLLQLVNYLRSNIDMAARYY